MLEWNLEWIKFIPGFYYFLWRSFVHGFVRALPEDGNAASWSQRPVVLLHDQGRDREEAAAIKATVDQAAQIHAGEQ